MNPQVSILSAAAAAGLMYFLDPDRGRRRRAIMRDKAASLAAHSGDAFRKVGRDLTNRASGAVACTMSAVRSGEQVEDPVIEARVRSKMGRVVSHPGSIHVTCEGGRVALSGPVLAQEVEHLLSAVWSVPGVDDVENRLEVHQQAGEAPGLQGGRARPGEAPELWQSNWTPAVRMLAGVSGGALAAYGFSRGNAAGLVTGLLGAGLMTRAMTNLETKRLVGVGAGRRAVDVQKTMTIHAPVDEVFRFWTAYENFPRFMTHIREVRDHGNGRSHWVADGPAGRNVSWDSEITKFETNKLLAWKSTPGSTVENAGIIHFESTPEGHTRVHMQISYNPPAGAVGHAVAWLFGRDLKSELNDDLVRFKSLLEQGKTRSGSGERITRSELESNLQPSLT